MWHSRLTKFGAFRLNQPVYLHDENLDFLLELRTFESTVALALAFSLLDLGTFESSVGSST